MLNTHQLVQAILNILSNAEKAMYSAHGGGNLLVRASSNQTKLLISISDDGPGIPEYYLKRIFDPFFTTKDPGKGTGLGLSVSHGVIQTHKAPEHTDLKHLCHLSPVSWENIILYGDYIPNRGKIESRNP